MINRFIRIAVSTAGFSLAAAMLVGGVARAAVPAVVAESAAKIVAPFTGANVTVTPSFYNPAGLAVDGSGNVFIADTSGRLFEVPAGTGTPTQIFPTVAGVAAKQTGLSGNSSVTVDSSGDVIVGIQYNNGVYLFKNNNGVISSTPIYIGGNNTWGGLDGYYAVISAVAIVNGTQMYAAMSTANGGNSTAIFTATTKATGGAKFLASLPGGKVAVSMAGDNNSNLYYADGAGVYAVKTTGVPSPVAIGTGLNAPNGVAVDGAGNLYITDTGNRRIVVIPNEGGKLNAADQYVAAVNISPSYGVGVDSQGNIYYSDRTVNTLNKVTMGATPFATTAPGSISASVTTNFIFNAASTPTSISYLQGTGISKEFVAAGGSCAVNTAQAAASYCTVTATFNPSTAGVRTGTIVLGAGGKAIGTAYLFGTGNGAAVSIDPGAETIVTGLASPSTSYKSPSAVAFDAAGNLYTVDASLGTVFVTPAGAAAATTSVGAGLSLPGGVTVDAAGNVYIADTGNNRVVEVPNESGTLNTADQVVLPLTGLSKPTGIRASLDGSLYVVDSGNTRVLRVTTFYGLANATQSTLGSGFKTPAGVTTDQTGNVYVSDSTANNVTVFNPLTGVSSVLASGLSGPTAIAVDPAGDLYCVNSGNATVQMIPFVAGVQGTTKVALISELSAPTGLALDGLGNAAVADGGTSTVYTIARTSGAVNFGNVNLQLQSTAQQVTVSSVGTLPLTFGTPYQVTTGASANFVAQTPASPCISGATLPTGTACAVSEIFAPVAVNAQSETVTFATNATNAVTPVAVFSGFATNLSLTNTVLSIQPSTSLTFGQTVVVTAAVTATRAGYTPTGTVTFFLDGSKAGTAQPLGQGSATFTFSIVAGNTLQAGAHVITASYNGDSNNAASSSTNTLNVKVTQATANVGLKVYPTWAVQPGSSLAFTATVTPPVAVTPTGTITLSLSGTTTVIATQALTAGAGTTAVAKVTLPATVTAVGGQLYLGQYQIVASYGGDGNYLAGVSNTAGVLVQNPSYTVSVANTNLTVKQGGSVSTTVTVTTLAGYGGHYYTPQTSTAAAAISSELIQDFCSTLPVHASCTFAPGFQLVNSYNATDACAAYIANNSANAVAPLTTLCAYDQYTGNCTPVVSSTVNAGAYCSDYNFPNTYNVTLTIQTDVAPPSLAGMTLGRLWPVCLLSMAGLAWMSRRRPKTRSGPMVLLTVTLLLSMTMGTVGCGSGKSVYVSPVGTTAFNAMFVGQNPVGFAATGGTNTNTTADALVQYSVTGNVLTAQTAALPSAVSNVVTPGSIVVFSGMGYTTAVTTGPTGATGTTVTTTTTLPALNTSTLGVVSFVNPGVTSVPQTGGTGAQFSVNLTTPNVPLVAASTTSTTSNGTTVTTTITPTGSATITLPSLVQTIPMQLTITN